jgi:hypothetical protein
MGAEYHWGRLCSSVINGSLGDAFALDIYLGPGLAKQLLPGLLSSPKTIDEGDLQGFLFADGFGVLFRFGISVGAAF